VSVHNLYVSKTHGRVPPRCFHGYVIFSTGEFTTFREISPNVYERLYAPHCQECTVTHAAETIVEDPKTGGRKGRKLAELGAICPRALRHLAEVAGFGGRKYERANFLKGYSYSLSYDALHRHLLAFWGGEDVDEESGLPHLAHASWHCLALLAFRERRIGTDDRPL
jgi:hypothetical protein